MSRETKPGLAAFIGFAFGGVGLAIYFRSFIDFLFPIAVVLLFASAASALGWFAGAVLAGVYGFYRSQSSNERLNAGSARPATGPAGDAPTPQT